MRDALFVTAVPSSTIGTSAGGSTAGQRALEAAFAPAGSLPDAEAYVRAFAQGLKIQAERGSADDVQMRLATDEGRAFMLLDAAVGDLS